MTEDPASSAKSTSSDVRKNPKLLFLLDIIGISSPLGSAGVLLNPTFNVTQAPQHLSTVANTTDLLTDTKIRNAKARSKEYNLSDPR